MNPDTTFYDDDGRFYAAVGPFGTDGLFSLRRGNKPKWQILTPNSQQWDSVSQALFRNQRGMVLKAAGLPPGTPELPELPPLPPPPPPPPPPSWADNFNPVNGFPSESFPRITATLETKNKHKTPVFIVLKEDAYESSMGDGRYDYFEAAFQSETEALAYVASQPEERCINYHHRQDSIQLEKDRLSFAGRSWEQYSHHQASEVLHALESLLSKTDTGS